MNTSPLFHFRYSHATQAEKVLQRQTVLRERTGQDFPQLFATDFDVEVAGAKNCENLIGSVSVPVGVAGPVLVNGDVFDGGTAELLLPLATSEGALLASISRGCKAVNQSAGASVFVEKTGMSRAPVFVCADGSGAHAFERWMAEHITAFAAACESTSTHLKFLEYQSWVRGRHVYLRFVFDTDEAMGMNMVTIAIQRAWEQLQNAADAAVPGGVELLAISSNLCADKKDSVVNRLLGRGYSAQIEVFLSADVLRDVLKTTAEQFLAVHVAKNLVGSNLAGSLSQNMHVGNSVAAMFLATGQDMAHVTEASQATTIVEPDGDGVYVAVSLPNLPLGTVGGGTWLPAQRQARTLILSGAALSAQQLAAAVSVRALAGEISGIAALASNSLAQAHQQLGRGVSNRVADQDKKSENEAA